MKLKPKRSLRNKKHAGVFFFLMLLFGLAACSNDSYSGSEDKEQGMLTLNVSGVPAGLTVPPAEDMRLLLAERSAGVPSGRFSYEIYGISRQGNTLTSLIRTGNWHLTMVSPQGAVLHNPVAGRSMAGQLMYEYRPAVSEGKSSLAHQFYFGQESLPEVHEDQTVVVNSGRIARNVAMVRVFAEQTRNINPAGEQSVRLYKVPSRIDWNGGLIPSKTRPDTLALPLQGRLNFTPREDGSFRSDTMIFIIPAHRGTDFWNVDGTLNPNPTDLLSLRMDIGIDFTLNDGNSFRLKKTLPVVTRCNQILDVKLILNSLDLMLDCDFSTLPVWEEVISDNPNLH